MNMIAIKRALALSLTVGAGLLASPASAQEGEPLYIHHYYSDATYTDEVGYYRDTCNLYGVGATAIVGRSSDYEQLEIYAMCVNGQLAPY